jgi:DNA-binding phage protein
VPRRSKPYRAPRDWVADGDWPDARFYADTPDVVGYAAEIARRLGAVVRAVNKTELSTSAEIERSTLYDVLAGRTWPDIITLAQLERLLEVRLWPSEGVDLTLRRVRQNRPT